MYCIIWDIGNLKKNIYYKVHIKYCPNDHNKI